MGRADAERVQDIDQKVLGLAPDIPWSDAAQMRDRLSHRYSDTAHSIVAGTVHKDLPELYDAILRIEARLP